ncbi:MAG: T9SS type A sorting domain-containing protein [Lewinellaceae bacterium]|nr:T9SS type A sorting domain-containing protein [Lewinellaceae bacterium]
MLKPDTDPALALIPTGEDCDQYELRMYDPPTDPLARLNVSVRFSGDVQVIQAALGSELAAAGGYSLDVDNPPTIPRVNINRSDINNGFTLPNTTSSWLTLFIFSFAGTPNSTVTAEIDASAMILLRVPGGSSQACPPTFVNSPVSCTFGEGSTISGLITSIQQCEGSANHGLEGVEVTISSTSLPGPVGCQDTTDNSGNYGCETIANEDYLIAPKFVGADPLCGVDDADIIMIGGQVLGSFPFTDPWQYVAADFNLDNAITTVDQISIRKAILFGEFPANFQAWRLIAADGLAGSILTFNLANINETISLQDVPPGPAPNNNFIGVKVGDVQVSCTVCIHERSHAPLSNAPLQVQAARGLPGETLELALSPDNPAGELLLHTIELEVSELHFELLGIKGTGGFQLQEQGYLLDLPNGYFRAIWLPQGNQPLTLEEQAQLILTVRVKKAFDSVEGLVRLLPRSNLFPGLEGKAWELRYAQAVPVRAWPNPFQGQLKFTPSEQGANLKVFDIRGALVHQASSIGHHEYQIAADGWPAGVYFYQWVEGNAIHTGKLIKQ